MTAPSELDTDKPVLQARDIVKTYGGVTALDGVSFDLRPAKYICLAGENGCGKSTLIKIISGAERPDSGEIVVDDVAHRAMNATAAITSGIQVIYQDFSLFGNLTVAENIALTSAVAERRKALLTRHRAEDRARHRRRSAPEPGSRCRRRNPAGRRPATHRHLSRRCARGARHHHGRAHHRTHPQRGRPPLRSSSRRYGRAASGWSSSPTSSTRCCESRSG